MTEMNRLVAYIAQPEIDDALDARLPVGANFDPAAMCSYCQRLAAGEEHQDFGDNVTSIFTSCRHWNGCMVCAFCGLPMFDAFTDHAALGTGTRDCTTCGAVGVSAAWRFADTIAERLDACREALVEWRRRIRRLDLLGVAVGIAVFDARQNGDPLSEEDVERFFDAALTMLRTTPTEEIANRFFDRLQEAIASADGLTAHTVPAALKLVVSDGTEARDAAPA